MKNIKNKGANLKIEKENCIILYGKMKASTKIFAITFSPFILVVISLMRDVDS